MLALLAMMMMPQEQTTTCQEVGGQTVCTTTDRTLDGYAGALGRMPSYNELEMQRQQVEALKLQNRAARNALERPSRNAAWTAECAKLAVDILKAGQPDLSDRLLSLCER
jgi:hypothetical protein